MTTRSYYAGKVLTLEDGVLSWFRNRLLHSKLGGTCRIRAGKAAFLPSTNAVAAGWSVGNASSI